MALRALSRREWLRLGGAVAAPRSGLWLAARGREHETHTGEAAPPDGSSILLNSNENPVGPSQAALDAVVAALPRASRYPDPGKVDVPQSALIQAIAKAVGVAAENVVLGAGSAELLAGAVHAFASPTKAVVTAWPSFETPHTTADRNKIPVTEVALDAKLRLDVDAMARAAKGAGLVFFCNPNNPTGTVHGADTVKDMVARIHALSPDTVILIDEAYHDYVTDPSYATAAALAAATPNVLVTRTFSKAHGMAGLRIGYAIGERATVRALGRYRNPLGQAVPGVAAAAASIADAAHIASERDRNTQVRGETTSFFAKLGLTATESNANFIYVDIKRPVQLFREACSKAGVSVGRAFPPAGNTWCRISIGTAAEMTRAMDVFEQALKA